MTYMMASPTAITKQREGNNKKADTKNLPNLEWRKMSDRQQKEKDILDARKD
jgi:hypothetical protein